MLKDIVYTILFSIILMSQLTAGGYKNTKTRNERQSKIQPIQNNKPNNHSNSNQQTYNSNQPQHSNIVLHKSDRPYPNNFIILKSRHNGMFSMVDDVFELIKRYEVGYYKGIEIDFEDGGIYYDRKHGKNWWSYYFEPIRLGTKKNIKKIMFSGNPYYIMFQTKEDIYRREIFNSMQKYFKIKPHIQKKIDALAQELFKDFFVISVHYRGTDKTIEAPAVPYEKIPEEVLKIMKTYGDMKYKIFVATDEQAFLDYMKSIFGDIVCYNKDALRSTNGHPVHTNKKLSRYKSGEDAIIDCVLLSKGDILIRTSSNLSRWSTYFNPNIPVVKLNTQFIFEK